MSRGHIEPILGAVPAARQEDARHYGVHPYFTRRPANVVRAYLGRYSREGDVVLDPFGGTGVTAIEAFLMGRRAIHNDLNPFANFIARNIADTSLTSTTALRQGFERVQEACRALLVELEADESSAARWLERVPLPPNIRLPRNSDAEFFYDLFTPRQLAGLALLKQAIEREAEDAVRGLLLLAWSASVAKLNKTFLSAKGRKESRGGSSIFSIYRYKLAARCVELPIWEAFAGRYRNVLTAKQEVLRVCDYRQRQPGGGAGWESEREFRVLAHDAAALDDVIPAGSVDYIFTDPPYGGFIAYLDLSILWNHWLGFPIADEARDRETIVGGERAHSEEHYRRALAQSVRTCLKLLRPDRWFSIVFQHWAVSYFATILETASECGAELKAAITQTGDVIWSMHKKKNSASVLAGEMILTFYKAGDPRPVAPDPEAAVETDASLLLSQVFDRCLANGAASLTSEAIFNRVILETWRRRALRCLSLDRREFSAQLKRRGWQYDTRTHLWSLPACQPRPVGELALAGR